MERRPPHIPEDYYVRIQTGLQLAYAASFDSLSRKLWRAYSEGLSLEERKEVRARLRNIRAGTTYLGSRRRKYLH